MIKEGALRKPKVDFAIGVHVDPTVPAGKIGLRDGPMMAAADDFTLSVLGTASHGAKPHLGVDAIALSAEVIQSLQTIPSRMINPTHPVVVTIGTISGGYRRNVIADRVDMEGTLRTLHAADRRKASALIGKLTASITRAAGGDYEYQFNDGYPILTCDSKIVAVVRRSSHELFGKRSTVEIDEPSMGGEDFAYFINEVPGMFMRLGTGNKKKGITYPWHHPKFDIDEKGLWVGAAVMARSVRILLEEF
jgi:amidohydrolase